ncbi:MAG: SGNH/GDSL hydrolase family protein [Acholeplasmataceae bacterium]|jgi:lysophospholipase L1-like esterase
MEKVIFLGDSIIAGFTLLNRFKNVINMGIGGDKTIEVIGRINSVSIQKPDKLFLMVGINDFTTNKEKWGDHLKIPFAESYHLLLHTLKLSLPQTKFFVMAILPLNVSSIVSPEEVKRFNEELDEKNQIIKKLANEFNMTFIDFTDKFKDKNNYLKEEFTIDGTHLTQAGYEVFYNEIKGLV